MSLVYSTNPEIRIPSEEEKTVETLPPSKQKLTVYKGDTPEALQKRILTQIEHPMLVSVIKDLCDDKIKVVDGKVVVG